MTKLNHITPPALPADLRQEIADLIRTAPAPDALRQRIHVYHEKDVALALPLLREDEQRRLFRALPPATAAAVLEYAADAAAPFSLLPTPQQAAILSCMETLDAAELLRRLPPQEHDALLRRLEPERRRELRLISSFPADAIGSRMSTNYIAIPAAATVKEAMSQLIRQAAEHDNISTLYLADGEGRFRGAIDLKDLIIAREGTPLGDITTVSYPCLRADAAIEDCVPFFRDYSEQSIPVLDGEGRLVGVVTAQDFVEILDDELGDDYAKLAGLAAEEDLAESVAQSVKKRLPWLCVLLVLGLGVSATVGLFESIVAQLPVILCFQSLILDMAGNVGTQSLAVAIRVLMDAPLERSRRAALVWKEARIGLLNGLLLGALSFVAIGGYLCLAGNGAGFAFAVSACLGLAMVLAMVVSSLSGTLIPLLFQRLGVDPAVASGPLITTVNDLVAVVSYYGLAWLLLLQTLHLG